MADLGCSDFKLFNHLRHVPNLKNIKAVDIDTKKIDLKSLKPLAADYLCPKLHGMSLSILQGNLKFINERLRNLDLICMIEVNAHVKRKVTADKIHETVSCLLFSVQIPSIESQCIHNNMIKDDY
ncbi:MAG: Small RNA 2'-O-methyltransferase [Marteilia pararefringens]